MHKILSSIKAVGFDLDRTLYFETSDMQRRIADEIIRKVLEVKPELAGIRNIGEILKEKCRASRSWIRVMQSIGVEDPAEIMMRCSASANIVEFIKEDRRLVHIMESLGRKYFLFLITGSSKELGIAKLKKIGISPSVFGFALFGDDDDFVSKMLPDNFVYLFSRSSYVPQECVYIGDNLNTDIIVPKLLGIKTVFVGACVPEADLWVEVIYDIENLLL